MNGYNERELLCITRGQSLTFFVFSSFVHPNLCFLQKRLSQVFDIHVHLQCPQILARFCAFASIRVLHARNAAPLLCFQVRCRSSVTEIITSVFYIADFNIGAPLCRCADCACAVCTSIAYAAVTNIGSLPKTAES